MSVYENKTQCGLMCVFKEDRRWLCRWWCGPQMVFFPCTRKQLKKMLGQLVISVKRPANW